MSTSYDDTDTDTDTDPDTGIVGTSGHFPESFS